MQTSFPVPKMSYINTYIIVYNESKKGKKKKKLSDSALYLHAFITGMWWSTFQSNSNEGGC